MPDVQSSPFDVWHVVFQHVCTDGGYSGCALARTSKAFRSLSASTRFYSLTLSSLTQVKNFLVCLERIRRFERARTSSASSVHETSEAGSPNPIYHLLLSFLPDTCDAPQRTFRKWTDYARDERSLVFQLANDHKAWAVQKAHWNRDFVLHVSRLLQLAAPTLRGGGDAGSVGDELFVLVIDLDDFKIVNDTAGHRAGDEVLRAVADMIEAHFPAAVTRARIGGDEFLVLPAAEDQEAPAGRLAEQLIELLQDFDGEDDDEDEDDDPDGDDAERADRPASSRQ